MEKSETDPSRKIGYHSFLLRLWQVKQSVGASWQVSLEDPHTGQQRFFSSVDALYEFLLELTQEIEGKMAN